MGKYQETEQKPINLISLGTEIAGDINTSGDIRIDGKLEGNLVTKGKIVIGETGALKGTINCSNADVSGSIEGKVNVKELLSLKRTSKILGDIITDKLAIEPGAKFTGTCKMDSSSATSSEISGKEKKESKLDK